MAKDVVITPASGLIDFKNASGVSVSTIQLADNGNFSVGNTASNLYIGDGTNSVDIIFEQNGKVRALTGKTLTLGQTDSTVNLNAPLTYTSPDGTKTVTTSMLNSGTLSISGSAGQLFSVNNSFTGTTFSVNDVSGIPSIEVLDTGLVKLAQYGGNVLIGTGIDDGIAKLQIRGNVTVVGNVTGNTFVSTIATGTAPLTVSSTTVVTNLNSDYLDGQHGSYYTTASNLSGTIPSAVLGNSTHYIGTTAIALNRSSASQALTGISSIDGTSAGITGGATNRIVYQTNSGTTSFIAAPTTASTFLQWNGSAFAWAAAGGSDPTPSIFAINTGII